MCKYNPINPLYTDLVALCTAMCRSVVAPHVSIEPPSVSDEIAAVSSSVRSMHVIGYAAHWRSQILMADLGHPILRTHLEPIRAPDPDPSKNPQACDATTGEGNKGWRNIL